MHAEPHILSVSALTRAVKSSLEGHFPFVWVRGQVTNVARPASGHVYFSLRDAEASLAAVWFRQQQQQAERFDPMTGEVFEDGPRPGLAGKLENGQEILCAGKLSVYAPRGTYQLIVELAEETGIGRLQAEFDRLRAKLLEQGFFAVERKRPLPTMPREIALITSPQGAAIHDFLRMAEARGCGARIRLYPVPVQGDSAPQAIAAALRKANSNMASQAIVLIRGGGSLEDLWAFNDERVAQGVYNSRLPVLAGIGHEIDFSLTDLTADVRAATPTHAAQLLWPERTIIFDTISQFDARLTRTGTRALSQWSQRLDHATRTLDWHSPERKLTLLRQRLIDLHNQCKSACVKRMTLLEERLSYCKTALSRSPTYRLSGRQEQLHFLTEKMTQAVFRRHEQQKTRLHRLDAGLAKGTERIPPQEQRLETLAGLLNHRGTLNLLQAGHSLERNRLHLEAVSPLAPLDRGYAILQSAQGQLIRSTSEVHPKDMLHIMVHDGSMTAEVATTSPEPSTPKKPSAS